MRLTLFTDYGIRVLLVLTARRDALVRISDAHLKKVANALAQTGWVETVRGRNGGMRLATDPAEWKRPKFDLALDFDNAAGNSTTTSGLLWVGTADLGRSWKMPWSASFASQQDRGGNPVEYSANYWQLELGLARGAETLRLGQEHLAGDAVLANRRFQTPLATLHAFQGWADKFLVTPPQGIDDRYLTLQTSFRGVVAQAQWHDFRAAAGSARYGREWDLALSRKLGQRYELLGKYANYSANSFATDIRKAWLMFTATLQ